MYDLYDLITHLKKCPFEFLKESVYTNKREGINTNALLLDCLRGIDHYYDDAYRIAEDEEFKKLKKDHVYALHISAWFFSHPDFKNKPDFSAKIREFMLFQLEVLSRYVPYLQWLEDDDRAEEFVRSALLSCEVCPQGEDLEKAYDRLDDVSILKRNNVLEQSKAAYDRIIQIRKQMAERKAREAANVYGRE